MAHLDVQKDLVYASSRIDGGFDWWVVVSSFTSPSAQITTPGLSVASAIYFTIDPFSNVITVNTSTMTRLDLSGWVCSIATNFFATALIAFQA